MFGLTACSTVSIIRRMALVLALALPASAWIVISGAALPASACDPSSHCYAEAVNQNNNTNHGVYGIINIHCLYEPNNGNFANAEMWDTNSSNANWVEAGIKSGVDYNGTYRNKNWFWADSRPGYSYSEHNFADTANTDTDYRVEIEFAGSDTWNVYGDGSFSQYGTSTNNSANLVQGIEGTEYLGGSSSGIRDVGNIYTLERKSSSNQWYTWDQNATNEDFGSGNYINGNYDSGADHESWSGPC